MFCQYKDKPTVFGKILDYQIPLKSTTNNSGIGKIDLLSSKTYKCDKKEQTKIYILELKKDNSKETLLRCVLEAYTYSKIVNKDKLCADFYTNFKTSYFVIAPLVFKFDNEFQKDLNTVKLLINSLDIPVEIFTWFYKSGEYIIEVMKE